LNWDIVDAMSTVKELVLSPFGIVFEPLGALVDGADDPQAAAVKATTAPRPTQLTGRSERDRRPPLLLVIPQNPFRLPEPLECEDRDTIQHACPFGIFR
jgi:hypothetical protein